MDSDIFWGRAGWAEPAFKSLVSERSYSMCTGSHRFKGFWKEENMLGMEQNKSFKGNVKWGYMVQRGAWGGIIRQYLVVAFQNWPLNRIFVRHQIWEDQPQQGSGFDLCLNVILAQRDIQLNSSDKPGIPKPCLSIRYNNSILLRESVNCQMIWDILYRIYLSRVKKLTAILLCSRLQIIEHGWFREFSHFFCDSSIWYTWNRPATNNWSQACMFRPTWKHGSCLQISVSQFHMNNIGWKWAVTAASTDSYTEQYTAP
jgi:hypothetical protein